MAELERKLDYKDIRFYRSIARSELRKERASARHDAQLHQQQSQSAGGGGWLGWIWGGGKQKDANDGGDAQDLLNDEQRKELYDAIDWNERSAVTASVDLPRDALNLRVRTKLDMGSFALRRDPQGKGNDIVALVFDAFQADFLQRPDNFEASVSLGGMRVYDGTRPGTRHPQIVRVKGEKGAVHVSSPSTITGGADAQAAVRRESDPNNPFFSAHFENNPLDDRADMALSVHMRFMEIIYHPGYLEEVVRFFKPPGKSTRIGCGTHRCGKRNTRGNSQGDSRWFRVCSGEAPNSELIRAFSVAHLIEPIAIAGGFASGHECVRSAFSSPSNFSFHSCG